MAHIHHVGQLVHLGQAVYLVKYVGCGEIALKALLTGLAEQAVHLTSHLTRHAERGAVVVGDVNRLNKLHGLAVVGACGLHGKEILDGAVFRVLRVDGGGATHLVALSEACAVGLRDVGHLVDGAHMVSVYPFGHLPSCESGHSQ